MIYKKPLIEMLTLDVEDIITASSTTDAPPETPLPEDITVQIPTGGTMGSFEDFDSPDSPAPSYYRPF